MKLKTLASRVKMLKAPAKVATEINPSSWRTSDQTAAQRGYGHKWREARAGYLAKHPFCVMCEAEGRPTAATVVDHKVAHRGDMKVFWDKSQWQSLCAHHHNSEAQRRDKAML